MKIVVITGSPHKNGSSEVLAEEFIAGAHKAGHMVYKFDAAAKKIHPCIACDKCHMEKSGCVFDDDMSELNRHLIESDAVVFVSPIYYYAITSQLKAVIDRFYANDAAIQNGKKSALILAFADDTDSAAKGAAESFKSMCGYLGWKNVGVIAACGCSDPAGVHESPFPGQARLLGRNIANL